MLVVFGANGRTGVQIVRQAMARGLPVRPVCRDNRDQHRLLEFLEPRQIFHADPDRPQTLQVVVEGATTLLSCLDPRTIGVDGDQFSYKAAEHVLSAATAPQKIHLSVVGANRWSFDPLERRAGFMEFGATKAGAVLLRVSAYHDELAGCRKAPTGRYAPISREEAARLILDWLPHATSGAIGGPEVLSGAELRKMPRSMTPVPDFPGLPNRDLSVDPAETQRLLGAMPVERLENWLRTPPPPPSEKPDIHRHPADNGQNIPTLFLSSPFRHALFEQLLLDAGRLQISATTLDFTDAIPAGPREETRSGVLTALENVALLGADGTPLYRGAIDYFYDDPSRSVFFWWSDAGLPRSVWDQLDVVARKRLRQDPRHTQAVVALRV